MMARRINLYFAALTPTESLRLLINTPWSLLAGGATESVVRTRLEQQWCERTGAADAIATPTARAGLYALLDAFDIGAGDEVLVTGFTCEAVPEPIQFRGATPVYVDIDRRHFAMDPSIAAAAITPRTKAIIVQHTFGLPAPIEALMALARTHRLIVIEDCALALGSQLNGRWLGTSGDAAVFSFELSKTLTAGWGGMVQVNCGGDLAARLRRIRDRAGAQRRLAASRRVFQAGLSGLLYRPEIARFTGKPIAALFLLGLFRRSATESSDAEPPADYLAAPASAPWQILERQLNRLDRVLETRRHIAACYQSVLSRHGARALVSPAQTGIRLIRFPLLVADRERFTKAFARVGIEVGRWFSQPVSCSGGDMRRYGYTTGSCPTAEFVAAHIVNLPLHERLSARDVALTVACLDQYLEDHPDEREFVAAA